MRGITLAVALTLASSQAFAHGGGVDSNGCHRDSSTGLRHCHGGGGSTGGGTSTGSGGASSGTSPSTGLLITAGVVLVLGALAGVALCAPKSGNTAIEDSRAATALAFQRHEKNEDVVTLSDAPIDIPERGLGFIPAGQEIGSVPAGTARLSTSWLGMDNMRNFSMQLTSSRPPEGPPKITLYVSVNSPMSMLADDPSLLLFTDTWRSELMLQRASSSAQEVGGPAELAFAEIGCGDVRQLATARVIEARVTRRDGSMRSRERAILGRFAAAACPAEPTEQPAPTAQP